VNAAFPECSQVEERLEKEANVRPDAFEGLEVAADHELAEERLDDDDDYNYSDWSSEDEGEKGTVLYSKFQSGGSYPGEDIEGDSDVFIDSWGSD
jgi:hypothetical protein